MSAGRTLLVFPPLWGDSAAPPLGLAVLAGALTDAGLRVSILDLNVRFLRQLCAPASLAELLAGATRRSGGEALARLVGTRAPVGQLEAAALRALATCLGLDPDAGPRALSGTDDSRARLTDFVSAAAPTSPARVFWDATMRRVVAQDVAPLRPTLVGVTLSTAEQVLPAIALARAIRAAGLETRIFAGGPWSTFMSLGCDPEVGAAAPTAMFELFDALCVGPGDETIVALARAAPGLPDPLPANLWRPGGLAPRVRRCKIATPNFVAMPLDEYFCGGQAQFPLEATRGCFWARCRYCSYHELNAGYLVKSLDRVAEEALMTQVLRPGAALTFVDDVVVPKRALAIAETLARVAGRTGRRIRWSTSMRPDAELDADAAARLRDSGLFKVFIGLEAGSQALLDEVDKGTELDRAGALVRALSGAGIRVAANFILGLPGEAPSDRGAALRLAESLALQPEDISVSQFALARGAGYYRDMTRLGLDPAYIEDVRSNDLLVNFHPPTLPRPLGGAR